MARKKNKLALYISGQKHQHPMINGKRHCMNKSKHKPKTARKGIKLGPQRSKAEKEAAAALAGMGSVPARRGLE